MYYKMNTKAKYNKGEQAKRLSAELLSMKADVTSEDRLSAESELGFVKATISKYLNGKVYDNDTAAKMISFFRKRIADREAVLA